MAINLGGLLGGIGQGLMSLSEQQRQQRAQDLTQAQQERQFQQGQRQNLLNFALQARQFDLSRAAGERAQKALEDREARDVYSEIARLAGIDQADDEKTYKDLQTWGMSDEEKASIKEARLRRHEAFVQQTQSLAGLPAVKSRYGDAASLIKPSRLLGQGFTMPGPRVSGETALGLLKTERTRIEQLPDSAKGAAVAQARTEMAGLGINQQQIDQFLPSYRSVMQGQFQAPKVIGRVPKGAFATVPSFAKGRGEYDWLGQPKDLPYGQPEMATGTTIEPTTGRRITTAPLGEGGYQRTSEEPIRATYDSPEKLSLANAAARLNLDFARRTFDPRVRKVEADARIAELNAALKNKDLEWFDREAAAKVKGLNAKGLRGSASSGNNTLNSLKAWIAEVNLNKAMLGFQMDMTERADKLDSKQQARADQFSNEARRLRGDAARARAAAALAQTKGQEGPRRAAMELSNLLDSQAAEIEKTISAAQQGRMGIAAGAGAPFIDPTQGPDALRSLLSSPDALNRMTQLQVGGPAAYTSGLRQPAQAAPSTPSFSVNLGGVSVVAPGGGAAGPGAAGPGAVIPGPLPGPGGWGFPGGDQGAAGGFDPNRQYGGGPQLTPDKISQLKSAFPGLSLDRIRPYLQPDGTINPAFKPMLNQLNAQALAQKPKPSTPKATPEKTKPNKTQASAGQNRAEGYYIKETGKPYRGPVTKVGGVFYAVSPFDYQKLKQSNVKIPVVEYFNPEDTEQSKSARSKALGRAAQGATFNPSGVGIGAD